jgi:hypothetical protein
MTDTRQHYKPTVKQMRLLRQLAIERGESFAMPTTKAEASEQIRRLKRRYRTPYADIRRERVQVSRDLAERGGTAAIQPGEVVGYGSSARWANGREL